MLQILGRNSSINVRKVLWTCAELGLPYELQAWASGPDAGAFSIESAAYRALNPNAMIPVIREGDFVLWESNAICRYLANAHGGEALLPSVPQERARVEQWMDWQATELNNAWRYAYLALVHKRPAHVDAAAIAASIASWNRHMAILATQLERSGAFVTGTRFTLADVVLGLSLNRWLATPIERPPLPALAAYHERLLERPGYRLHGANGMP